MERKLSNKHYESGENLKVNLFSEKAFLQHNHLEVTMQSNSISLIANTVMEIYDLLKAVNSSVTKTKLQHL
jgi:hypothetical protein